MAACGGGWLVAPLGGWALGPGSLLLAPRGASLPRDGEQVGAPTLAPRRVALRHEPKRFGGLVMAALAVEAAKRARGECLRLRMPVDLAAPLGVGAPLANTCVAIPVELDRRRAGARGASCVGAAGALPRGVAGRGAARRPSLQVAVVLECLVTARLVGREALRKNARPGLLAHPRTNTLVATHVGPVDASFARMPARIVDAWGHTPTWAQLHLFRARAVLAVHVLRRLGVAGAPGRAPQTPWRRGWRGWTSVCGRAAHEPAELVRGPLAARRLRLAARRGGAKAVGVDLPQALRGLALGAVPQGSADAAHGADARHRGGLAAVGGGVLGQRVCALVCNTLGGEAAVDADDVGGVGRGLAWAGGDAGGAAGHGGLVSGRPSRGRGDRARHDGHPRPLAPPDLCGLVRVLGGPDALGPERVDVGGLGLGRRADAPAGADRGGPPRQAPRPSVDRVRGPRTRRYV